MNILNVVPKSAAVLELLHALKHPGHDDQSVHGGGGGGGLSSGVEARYGAGPQGANDRGRDLDAQLMDLQDAVESDGDAQDQKRFDQANSALATAAELTSEAAYAFDEGDTTASQSMVLEAHAALDRAEAAIDKLMSDFFG